MRLLLFSCVLLNPVGSQMHKAWLCLLFCLMKSCSLWVVMYRCEICHSKAIVNAMM